MYCAPLCSFDYSGLTPVHYQAHDNVIFLLNRIEDYV